MCVQRPPPHPEGAARYVSAHLPRKLLRRVGVDLTLRGEVGLVADEQLVHVLRRVPINLVQPRLHVVERGALGDIVNDDDAVRAAVVAARNRALYPRVPDLQLDRLAVELDRPDPEFAARRRDVPVGELVVLWAQESGRMRVN